MTISETPLPLADRPMKADVSFRIDGRHAPW